MRGKSATTLDKIISRRRSERNYLPGEVKERVIKKLIQAATWAPSPHNAQPWRFVIIRNQEKKKTLARAMAQKYRVDMGADGLEPEVIEERVERSLKRIIEAPLLILACLSMEDMDSYPDKKRQSAERDMAVQAIGAAIQNMLLTAHCRGLGACWMCAPLFCPEVVRVSLGLREEFAPQALITIGYAGSKTAPPPRLPPEYVTLWD